jgi:hypothetical protein
MPKPIVCLSEQLCQFLEIFRPCFSQRQWKYFVIVLLGLIECEERKTLTGLLRVIGERVSLSGLSRFLNQWCWSPEKVTHTWLLHFRRRLEGLVQAEHARLKAELPKRVGRPKQTVVTGFLVFDDSVHEKPKGRKMGGLGNHFSNTEQQRNWQVSGALKSNRVMRRITDDGGREWIKLSAYAARLAREDWSEVVWPSTAGGQRLYAHLLPTWIRKLGPTLLLITCHALDQPLKSVRYWGSTRMDLDAQSLVDILAVRWEVETFFEYEKDLLGSDHYQVMTRQAILRFWTLTACLLCFLEEQRTSMESPQATCGDARRMIQDEHRSNFLHWLQAQFRDGLTVQQVRSQLALSNS